MKRCLLAGLLVTAGCGGVKESPHIDPAAAAAPADPAASPSQESASANPSKPGTPVESTPAATSVDPLAGIATVAQVRDGFAYVEGPTWLAASQQLLFSDIPNSAIVSFAQPASFTTFRSPSGKANGLTVDRKGRLLACEGLTRRVTRTRTNGTIEILADNYEGNALNAPNDVAARSDDTVYFTDPDYSVAGPKELSFNGVYRIAADKTLSLIADDLEKPNGIAFSADEKTLYVGDEAAGLVRTYDIAADGTASNPRKFAEVPNADGFAVDDQGDLYVSSKDSIVVFRPDGSTVGAIPVPKQPANCTFGGVDRKTLFITAQDAIYSVTLNVPGLP